jgi:hypothetical protein
MFSTIVSRYEYPSHQGGKKIDWQMMISELTDFDFEKSRDEAIHSKSALLRNGRMVKPGSPKIPEIKTNIAVEDMDIQNY